MVEMADLVEVFRLRNPIRSPVGHEAANLVQICHILGFLILAIVVLTMGILKLVGLAGQDAETAIPVHLLAYCQTEVFCAEDECESI